MIFEQFLYLFCGSKISQVVVFGVDGFSFQLNPPTDLKFAFLQKIFWHNFS
jgi:hypothetical protein